MSKRIVTALLFLVLVSSALMVAGCGSGQDEFTTAEDVQRLAKAGEALTMSLDGGYTLGLPATLLQNDAIVLFSKHLLTETVRTYFPTATQASEDLLSAVIVNTPADLLMHANMTLTLGLADGTSLVPGTQYVLYRLDRENLRWNPWGHTAAVVDAGGTTLSCTLPTSEMRGYVGSVAVFKGLTVDTLPAGANTTIRGTVVDGGGLPVATDVAVYVLVGAVKYPAAVSNGRIPAGGTLANTVDSQADGTFTINIPDNLIGQFVGLEFGREDTQRGLQEEFDVLAPATLQNSVNYLVVRFGENNVRSRPVVISTK